MRYDGMSVFEVAEATGHDVCETCREQVCNNPGHSAGCVFDPPGYVTADGSLVFCQECGPAARLEDEPTQVEPIPLACDTEETTPIRHETAAELAQKMDQRAKGVPEPRRADRSQWLWAILVVAISAWGMAGCAAHAPAPEVETVGQLAAGPSVYSAPLAHDEPPVLGGVADTGDEIHAMAGASERADGAPEIEVKDGGIQVGAVR